ncbi:hypothetical protein ACS0TY_018372 [Phlomoides rotata]
MISTQRSEGMHAYFDEFVHSRSTLKYFMEQYDMAIGNKIQKEFIVDFQSKNKVVKCVSTFRWEKQFQWVYTNSIFKLVQEKINWMMYCQVIPSEEVSNEIGVDVIKVLERSGYPHMTEEYKKFQEVENFFQQCIEIAMGSLDKLEFIKERCKDERCTRKLGSYNK